MTNADVFTMSYKDFQDWVIDRVINYTLSISDKLIIIDILDKMNHCTGDKDELWEDLRYLARMVVVRNDLYYKIVEPLLPHIMQRKEKIKEVDNSDGY